MRFIFVGLFLAASWILSPTSSYSVKVDTGTYPHMQKQIWQLFKYINQPTYYKEHIEIAKTFNFEEHYKVSTKSEAVHDFLKYYKHSLLPKGEIFSVFYEPHLKQAIDLFKVFYYAKDFDMFYKTAVWARHHVNEGMFLYAFSVAVVHRPDTHHIVLPPIYEVYPYYFYNSEVIHKAQYYKQLYYGATSGGGHSYNGMTIYANYSGHYLNLHPEQYMSYLTEDVQMNAFYYYFHLYYPFWMNGEEFHLKNDHRGELFMHVYQQILARYYLERISNEFGQIENFDWDTPFTNGYYPSLSYHTGLEFPTRPHNVLLHEYFYNYGQNVRMSNMYAFSHRLVKESERRISDAIDIGFAYSKDGQKVSLYGEHGTDMVGNIVEGNDDSPHPDYFGHYQMFARHLLGYSYQPLNDHKVYPSALEHFETSMRDPAFYQVFKKMLIFHLKYTRHAGPYSEKDIYFKGVHVEKVDFDRLITYFDYFYTDIMNAVYVTPEEMMQDSFKVQVAQERLNHKPFSYKITVSSEKDTDAVVKVFIGPKYDEYDRYINLTENRLNFVQFDHFKYHLKAGKSVIERQSKEIHNYMHDRGTFYDTYQKIMSYYSDKDYNFDFYPDQILFGFPQRLMLPKGSYDGQIFQFYVIVYPYTPYKGYKGAQDTTAIGSGAQYVDGYPMGYPFDRPIHEEYIYHEAPNAKFYETKIYHRMLKDINVTA